MSDHKAEPASVTADESELRRAATELPGWELAESATTVLAVAIERATAEDVVFSDPRQQAAVAAAIRGFRAIRSGLVVMASGYELEADSLARVMVELYLNVRPAIDDDAGEEARAWLTGKRERGITGRAEEAFGSRRPYKTLSMAAHGDARALAHLIVEEGDGQIVRWGPSRTERSQALLFGFTVGARDFAVLLEEAGLGLIPELGPLDRWMERDIPGFKANFNWYEHVRARGEGSPPEEG